MEAADALRGQHPRLRQRSLEMLHPSNHHELAINRELVTIGTSSLQSSLFSQPVELDLGRIRGWTPVELFGRIRLEIGDRPTHHPSGARVYWFRIVERPTACRVA